MFNKIIRTLGYVKHVPDLKRNIVSLSTLDAKEYKYTGEGGVFKVRKCALIVMKSSKKTVNSYVLHVITVIGDVVVASTYMSNGDVTKVWHM